MPTGTRAAPGWDVYAAGSLEGPVFRDASERDRRFYEMLEASLQIAKSAHDPHEAFAELQRFGAAARSSGFP